MDWPYTVEIVKDKIIIVDLTGTNNQVYIEKVKVYNIPASVDPTFATPKQNNDAVSELP